MPGLVTVLYRTELQLKSTEARAVHAAQPCCEAQNSDPRPNTISAKDATWYGGLIEVKVFLDLDLFAAAKDAALD